MTDTATIEKPGKPTGKAPYYDHGWWAVEMDNGRNLAFASRAKAEKFIRETATERKAA
jgi:hypothetical protein